MIQRKQTLWLGLIFLICISSVWINIPFRQIEGQLDGKVLEDALASVGYSSTSITIARDRVKTESNAPLKYLTLLLGVTALASILMYKNRNTQMLLGKIIYGLTILMIGLMYYYGWSKRYIDIKPESQIIISVIFPLLIAYANFKALSGIKHDENLVKSYDRLR
jgi:D-alanyl-lipoteichoic acid acyltransferase DltB (MBOAT superfamily)